MKNLLISCLVMVNVWNVWAIDNLNVNIEKFDFDKGIIIVRNGQYYNHVTFRGIDLK